MGSYRAFSAGAAFVILIILTGPSAHAQTSTTGAIHGTVKDGSTGSALAGATVVATSPALQGTQSDITDSAGRYQLTGLPPGSYLVTYYYADLNVQRKGVDVPLGQVTYVNQSIDTSKSSSEIIEIEDSGSTIDPTSTNQGTRITQSQLRNIPVPGRTFTSALGQAAGSSGDSRGVAFSGSTSLENQYVIDGVNTTGLTFGSVGTPLINEFIEEIQVLTGGYQAEYGRATGGIVNVITKQGSNELTGSVFATVRPYTVNRTPVREVQTSIDGTFDLDYLADIGFELGGPLIKDRLWFYVGFAPRVQQTNVTRTIQRLTDCRETMPDGSLSSCDPALGDGSIDEDPLTGDPIFEEVESTEFKTDALQFQFVTKVNWAVTQDHQGQVSFSGTPLSGEGVFGVDGPAAATRAKFQGLTSDVSAKWTSKFNDNKTEVELITGWHRAKYDQVALDGATLDTPTTRVFLSTLSRFGAAGGESARVMSPQTGCTDSSVPGTDPYPNIDNCPVFQYWLDSPGFTIDNLEDRRSAALKLTQRVTAAGNHVFKTGIDVENNRTVDVRHFTGGQFQQLIPDPGFNQIRIYRYVAPGAPGATDTCGFLTDDFGNADFNMPRACDYLDESEITGQTVNWSSFVQDSWQILPNLTLNAGLRYEEQRLLYAKEIRNTVDPFSEQPLGSEAIALRNMWAPRAGVIYDWTKEGRSKVYAHWGRFYESIPMALNDFSFSGTTLYGAFFGFEQCQGDTPSRDSSGVAPHPGDCPTQIDSATAPSAGEFFNGGITTVAPGTKAQFMDEIVVGSDYEVMEDLTLGVALKTRRIGRVLEDVSVDGADTYIIGNPGSFDADEDRALQRQLDRLEPGTQEFNELRDRLEGFRVLNQFDKPRRDYNAAELTATKRVSRNFYVQGSYTYSRTRGNYPGLLNDDTGSALPNISTQYDLPELMANRDGPLPQDRPHYLKLDGYYTFDFGEGGLVTTGIRFRALSGTPVDALGSNFTYGFGETYVLPRGAQGRTVSVSNTDLHLSYERKLGNGYGLAVYSDVINLFNQEQVAVTDELYTFDNVNPIVGGEFSDLVFAKQISQTGGETNEPIGRNIAFGTPLGRFAPLFIRIGARFTF